MNPYGAVELRTPVSQALGFGRTQLVIKVRVVPYSRLANQRTVEKSNVFRFAAKYDPLAAGKASCPKTGVGTDVRGLGLIPRGDQTRDTPNRRWNCGGRSIR